MLYEDKGKSCPPEKFAVVEVSEAAYFIIHNGCIEDKEVSNSRDKTLCGVFCTPASQESGYVVASLTFCYFRSTALSSGPQCARCSVVLAVFIKASVFNS